MVPTKHASLPQRCSAEEFELLISRVRVRHDMRLALMGIMVSGQTWRKAAELHKVSMSGILKALRRLAA